MAGQIKQLPFLLFFGSGTGIWTWGLQLAKEVLYHLNPILLSSHPHQPFCALAIFQVGAHVFFQGGPQTSILLPVAGITGVLHHSWLIDWDGILRTFCPGLPWSALLPLSAGITHVSHHAQPKAVLFIKFSFKLNVIGITRARMGNCNHR
jgi:hypothetical protein